VRKLIALAIGTSMLLLTACAATQATSVPQKLAMTSASSTSRDSRPTVTFAFTQQAVISGVQPQLRYAGSDLPVGSRVFLELEYGTPPQWDYVEALRAAGGTVALQALPVGVYHFRLAVMHGIDVVATSASLYLSVISPSGTACTACQLFGGIGGAVVTWILEKALPWLASKLP
jgi:hypothetical protein